jgi:hypothetical protein
VRLQLNQRDRDLIAHYKEIGVLSDVAAHLIDEQHGAIMVTCSDGDQFSDVFAHHAQHICMTQRHDSRIHLLALNGGAKLLAKDSPLLTVGEDAVLLKHIGAGIALKGIQTVVLYAHAPCGVAYEEDLPFDQVLDLLFRGKQRVKEMYPSTKVACFCHVDDGEKKRTYFVSREVWVSRRHKTRSEKTTTTV